MFQCGQWWVFTRYGSLVRLVSFSAPRVSDQRSVVGSEVKRIIALEVEIDLLLFPVAQRKIMSFMRLTQEHMHRI